MSAENKSEIIVQLEDEVSRLKLELAKSNLSEKRFLDALRLSPMALCHHDLDLKYTWLYNAHMGFVQDEVIGKTDWDILPKELADRLGVVKRGVLESGEGIRLEMPGVLSDEDSEYFDFVVEPLRDEDTEQIIGLSCCGIDVTEDRRRREAFKASEENLRFIFNASPMPIVVSHLMDGQPLFYNQAAQNAFHLDEWGERAHKYKGVLCWLGLRTSVDVGFAKGEIIFNQKFDFVNEAGEALYMMLSATRIYYDGTPAILSTFHDLTQEVHYQQHLKLAKEKAELANMAKSQFLASASHDLRQPLHAMGLLLSVLEQYVPDDAGQKVLNRITSSLEAMNELFSGILDISKLDANAVPVTFEPIRVHDLFKTLQIDFSAEAEEKELELVFVNSSCQVLSDGVQLERILRNLISNALRYTQKGRILVGCRRLNGNLTFHVFDTGIGIAKQNQKKVFEEFRQVGNPERDRRKGLGLGLAICERISQLLQTEIQLFSQEGKGSVFSFSLPLVDIEFLENDVNIVKDESSLEGRCILFIEDEIDVQIATKYMLEAWGCEALAAASITEALVLCAQHTQTPDMIIADYRLRENETGLQAIMEIRRYYKMNIPAVVLSGDTAAELICELERHGLTLLNKPLLPQSLRDCLFKMIPR